MIDFNANLASMLTLIAALSAAIISIINASKSAARNEVVKAKLEDIHVSTNGNLQELKSKIESLEKKSLVDTENLKSMQEIVKNLTSGSSVNIISPERRNISIDPLKK